MNQHFDPSVFILDQFQALGPSDRCRILDMLHQVVGPCAPIPAFEDMTAEARDWAALCDQKALTIYFDAIWQAFDESRKEAARGYLCVERKGPAVDQTTGPKQGRTRDE